MRKTLAGRVYGVHGFLLKLGPKLGGPLVKFVAYYALYKVFTSGGAEALAFVCYEHMLREGEEEKKARKNVKAV